jgi:hypothetical protein
MNNNLRSSKDDKTKPNNDLKSVASSQLYDSNPQPGTGTMIPYNGGGNVAAFVGGRKSVN